MYKRWFVQERRYKRLLCNGTFEEWKDGIKVRSLESLKDKVRSRPRSSCEICGYFMFETYMAGYRMTS